MTKLIETKNLTFRYYTENKEEIIALDSINFTLNKGEHIAIIGENGAGKSTFLQAIRGEIFPSPTSGGTIVWNETSQNDTENFSDSPLVARDICAIISPKEQNYYARQNWKVNCLEIVLAAANNDYILYREPSTEEVLRAVTIAKELDAEYLLYTPINQLSQGQLRIMLIARALMKKSPVILLDEPLNGLDKKTQDLFWQTLERLATSQSPDRPTIILTTHYFPLPSYIKRYYEMKKGKLFDITNNTANSFIEFTETISDFSNEKQENTAIQGMEIKLENASIYIDHKEIIKHISWHIKPQEHWTLMGHNGSGKSTLLKGILGLLPIAHGGSIIRNWYPNIHENTAHPLTLLSDIKEKIHFVSDALQALYPYDDIVEDVLFCGFDGDIGVHRERKDNEEKIIDELLYQLKLTDLRHRLFHSLSTGQARKVLLARAMIGDPALLLLDEPFSGLDPRNKQEIKEFLEYKIHKNSIQTILVSHIENDFLGSSQKFATLFRGEFQELI